ncbi:uncharacterized protein TA02835 [Theileria annulata]|uniref:t-SNARE coiled-coil homology domain-containing protein n=1 Tax=Theileria annulata TaxID=5874 RepID=Q4UHK7_THEAN|nr:uncharacterized protein TA02835 [Theileria annulata]CAI73432.1 hypothetical protein TA02835 [Theileria annulata]|eukprot:XP_954109.1 hypothetical protein TA02835 [Theileria annulata]
MGFQKNSALISMMDNENHWLLDIDDPCDKSLSTTPTDSETNFVNHSIRTNTKNSGFTNSVTKDTNSFTTEYTSDYSTDYSNGYSSEYNNGYCTDYSRDYSGANSVEYLGGSIDDSTPLFSADLETISLESYMSTISDLNREIEEFSKIVQTLALFKYYIKNRKPNTNVTELNKRFNCICADCSEKIRRIEDRLKRINYENHYVLVNRKRLELPYSEVRNRFNLQDSSVKKLRILIDTFNTVIREYTNLSKKLLSNSNKTMVTGINQTDSQDDKTLLNEMNDRVKQIELLEQSARDLNDLFIDLGNIIKKRGDNISSLENEILLSSEQIGNRLILILMINYSFR